MSTYTEIGGIVENIPRSAPFDQVFDYTYSRGICAYPFVRGEDALTVVNYWVE